MRFFKFNYFYLLTVVSLIIVYLNLLRFNSFQNQVNLIEDLSNNTYEFNVENLLNKSYPYPSLTVNSIPINTLKARYLINLNQIDEALRSIDEGLRYNPYMIYSHYLKARIYLSQNKLISSLEFLREGFKISPNNSYLTPLYFTLLGQLNQKEELIGVFDTISGINNIEVWKYYFLSLKNINQLEDKFLSLVIDEAVLSLGISMESFLAIVNIQQNSR